MVRPHLAVVPWPAISSPWPGSRPPGPPHPATSRPEDGQRGLGGEHDRGHRPGQTLGTQVEGGEEETDGTGWRRPTATDAHGPARDARRTRPTEATARAHGRGRVSPPSSSRVLPCPRASCSGGRYRSSAGRATDQGSV